MIKIETVLNILKRITTFVRSYKTENTTIQQVVFLLIKLATIVERSTPRPSFFVKGANFKKEFLEQAIEQDLQWYVAEQDFEVSIPAIIVTDIKQAMSLIAMEFYDHPERQLKLLAFTGTKGKTTSAYYAYKILEQGHRPAMLSTMNTTLMARPSSSQP